jgi:hypothetical protein
LNVIDAERPETKFASAAAFAGAFEEGTEACHRGDGATARGLWRPLVPTPGTLFEAMQGNEARAGRELTDPIGR